MKVGQGGNKRELKSNVALTAVNSKHQSYITTVDKVCDELRHYLQLEYSQFPWQLVGGPFDN